MTRSLVSERNAACRFSNHIRGASDTHLFSGVSLAQPELTRSISKCVTESNKVSKVDRSSIDFGRRDGRKDLRTLVINTGYRDSMRECRTGSGKVVEMCVTNIARFFKVVSGG